MRLQEGWVPLYIGINRDDDDDYLRVVLRQLVEHIDLELGGLAILLDVLDDLDGDDPPLVHVLALDHLAEGPLAQLAQDLVSDQTKIDSRYQASLL